MLGEINKSLEPIEYELILCKPDGTEIQPLSEAYNIQYSARYPTTDELRFEIPYYIMDNGNKVKNPNWDLIKGDYLILLNEEKYFVILEPDDDGGENTSKSVLCYSREYELNKKIIRDYNHTSRRLYTELPVVDEDGELRGIMNYVTTKTAWSLDIPSFMGEFEIVNKYRSFDVSEKTLLDFLVNDVQKTFGCIFLFDTINKKISMKNIEKLNSNKGLYISESNYIKTIKQRIKNDNIITRLYCYGNDGTTISRLNPTGTPYLEDFSFFKTTEYMNQSLIDALNAYDNLLEYHRQENTFENLLDDLDGLYGQLSNLENDLSELIADLNRKEDEIDSAIKLGQSLIALNSQKSAIESSIDNKKNEINGANSNIESKNIEIKNFRSLIAKESNFTPAQLSELDFFVREKTWSDSSYETEEDLYDEAVKQIQKLSQPPIEFEVDVIDFLKVVENQYDWGKLVLGDIATIEYDDFDLSIDVRLVGYTHNYDDNRLALQFSSKESLDNSLVYLAELQKQAVTSSTTIDMSKYKWDKSTDNASAINRLINDSLDASKNNVLAGRDQDVIVDRRGIWLTEKDNMGSIKPEQIRIISNAIVLSDDNFNTAKTAITPQGISAELLMGKTIIGQQGLFEGIDIYDNDEIVVEIGKFTHNNEEYSGIKMMSGILLGDNAKFNLIDGTFRLGESDDKFTLKFDNNNLQLGGNTLITGNNAKFDLSQGSFRLGESDSNFKLKFDGNDLVFGGGVLRWDNLDNQAKANLKGDKGDRGTNGSYYAPSWIKETYIDFKGVSSPAIYANNATIHGTLKGGKLNGTQIIQTSGNTITADLYTDSTYGARLKLFDAIGNLTGVFGAESGIHDNTGGTIVLYNKSVAKPRVELAIDGDQDSGVVQNKNSYGKVTSLMYGASNLGDDGMMMIMDSTGSTSSGVRLRGSGTSFLNGGNVAINKTIANYPLDVSGDISATKYRVGSSEGVTATFQTKDDKTVTITGGIITKIT